MQQFLGKLKIKSFILKLNFYFRTFKEKLGYLNFHEIFLKIEGTRALESWNFEQRSEVSDKWSINWHQHWKNNKKNFVFHLKINLFCFCFLLFHSTFFPFPLVHCKFFLHTYFTIFFFVFFYQKEIKSWNRACNKFWSIHFLCAVFDCIMMF